MDFLVILILATLHSASYQDISLTRKVGDSILIKCSFTQSLQNTLVILQKNNETIIQISKSMNQTNGRVSLYIAGSNFIQFNIVNLTASDTAIFVCIRRFNGTNTLGENKYNVTVQVPPTINITTSTTSQIVWKKDNISLTCKADGFPKPKVKWLNNAQEMISKHEDLGNTIYVFSAKKVENFTFICLASNGASNVTKSVTIQVLETLPGKPINLRLNQTKRAIRYNVTLRWEMGEQGKYDITNYTVSKTVFVKEGKNETVFETVNGTEKIFTDLNSNDRYQFSVKACNKKGCGEPVVGFHSLLEIVNITLVNKTSRSIWIQFADTRPEEVCITGNSPSPCKDTGVEAEGDGGDACSIRCYYEHCDKIKSRSINFTNLKPFCNYTFKSKFSKAILNIQTNVEAPGKPTDIIVRHIAEHNTQLDVSWKSPAVLSAPFVKYYILYKQIGAHHEKLEVNTGYQTNIFNSSIQQYNYSITNLLAFTKYTFEVVASNNRQMNSTSKPVNITTDESKPDPPSNLTFENVSYNSISVRWNSPSSQPLVSVYRVEFYPVNSTKKGDNLPKKVNGRTFKTLENLHEETFYTIKVVSEITQKRTNKKLYSSPLTGSTKTHTLVKKADDEKSKYALIVVTAIMLVLVLIFLVGAMCYCRHQNLVKSYQANFYVPAGFISETSFQPLPLSLRQNLRSAEVQHLPMTFVEFEKHVAEMHSNSDYLFSEEYSSLGPGLDKKNMTFEDSRSDANREKNRYQNIVAYDQTRVRLMSLDGITGSNYINANFVDGYKKSCAYIATQAPLSRTLADFWRMTWETKSQIVIMLTNLTEQNRKKCEQYWPSSGTELYKNYEVTIEHMTEYSDYVIRKLRVTRLERNKEAHESPSEPGEQRTIWQYHYTEWPDFGVPQDRRSVLLFILRCREHEEQYPDPPVIHCSAGVGRTGTYIMLDTLMRRYDEREDVDVYNTLKNIRKQRNHLVQREEQYIFIHDAILDYMKTGITKVPIDALETSLNRDDLLVTIETQWKLLDKVIIRSYFCASGQRACNRPKNRDDDIIPVDTSRVRLAVQTAIEGSDYINASYVDSYRTKDAFIITQAPLKTTVHDFWRMVWETNTLLIVSLLEQEEIEQEEVPYLPFNDSTTFRNFHIKIESERPQTNYSCRILLLTNTNVKEIDSKTRQIYHYHFRMWPSDFYPRMAFLFELLVDVTRQQKKVRHVLPRRRSFVQKRDLEPPIVIHCKCGVGRSGMFAALMHLMEQIEDCYGFVDIFSTVRTLMSRRQGLIQNIGQYDYLYKATLSLKHYVKKETRDNSEPFVIEL